MFKKPSITEAQINSFNAKQTAEFWNKERNKFVNIITKEIENHKLNLLKIEMEKMDELNKAKELVIFNQNLINENKKIRKRLKISFVILVSQIFIIMSTLFIFSFCK